MKIGSALAILLFLPFPLVETRPLPADFPPVVLSAKAAIVMDASSGAVLYAKNPSAQLPLASLTKLMTAFVATTSDQALLQKMLVISSNEIAEQVATAQGRDAFIRAMNHSAAALGLAQTFFLNPSGLDESTSTAGSYGSPRDIALLVRALAGRRPAVFSATRLAAFDGLPNTNPWITRTAGLLASKTGTTDLAGGNLAELVDLGFEHPVVFVVLGSTPDGRFADINTLIQAAVLYYGHAS